MAGLYAGCGLDTRGLDADGFVGTTGSGSGSSSSSGSTTPQCMDRSQCPSDTDCATYLCKDFHCEVTLLPEGTEVQAGKVVGDCKKIVCTPSGTTTIKNADDDPPASEPCLTRTCSNGEVQTTPVANGTVCGADLACKDGQCQGCTAADKCPPPMECHDVQCVDAACVYPNLPDGTEVGDNSNKTDCVHSVCVNGVKDTTAPDTSEIPPPDGNLCTADTCGANGQPLYAPSNAGAKCANAAGPCYLDSVCASGSCATQYAQLGTLLPDTLAGDCKRDACDGAGQTTLVPSNDPPPDNDLTDCKVPNCQNGVAGSMNAPNSSACGQGGTNDCCGGVCCAGAQAVCSGAGGNTCCNSGTVCGSSCCQSSTAVCGGAGGTTCCESGMKCGSSCCNGGMAVCGGANGSTCCESGMKCGTSCCSSGTAVCVMGGNTCCETGAKCADMCCPNAGDGCYNNNTMCCPMNKICGNGMTCCGPGQTCNGSQQCVP